jgi:hypothetical protein
VPAWSRQPPAARVIALARIVDPLAYPRAIGLDPDRAEAVHPGAAAQIKIQARWLWAAGGSLVCRSSCPEIPRACDVRHRSSLAVSCIVEAISWRAPVPVPQLNWPADLFSDAIRPDQNTLVVAQAANTSELSLWLVMQGLWRVNAAWTGDRDDI